MTDINRFFYRALLLSAAIFCVSPVMGQQGVETKRGTGAILRALDKVTSNLTDIELAPGDAADVGRLSVRLGECRYPADDPNADAFAQMVIINRNNGKTLFDGWMIASSPALSALDDARYDVWVLGCQRA